MNTDVIVRQLGPSDADLLERVPESFELGPVRRPSVERFLREPTHVCIVALHDDSIVGCILAHELCLLGEVEMFLYSMDTLGAHQRRGIGRRMLDELKTLCRSRGVATIWVPTHASNAEAIAFYEATGGKRGDPEVSFTYSL